MAPSTAPDIPGVVQHPQPQTQLGFPMDQRLDAPPPGNFCPRRGFTAPIQFFTRYRLKNNGALTHADAILYRRPDRTGRAMPRTRLKKKHPEPGRLSSA